MNNRGKEHLETKMWMQNIKNQSGLKPIPDYVIPYPMTHDGYVLGIFGSYLDFHIIWFGISVLCHGCNVLKVLGIIKC